MAIDVFLRKVLMQDQIQQVNGRKQALLRFHYRGLASCLCEKRSIICLRILIDNQEEGNEL